MIRRFLLVETELCTAVEELREQPAPTCTDEKHSCRLLETPRKRDRPVGSCWPHTSFLRSHQFLDAVPSLPLE